MQGRGVSPSLHGKPCKADLMPLHDVVVLGERGERGEHADVIQSNLCLITRYLKMKILFAHGYPHMMMLYLIIVLLTSLNPFLRPSSADLYRVFISCNHQTSLLTAPVRRSAVSVRAKECSEPRERKTGVLASQGSSLASSTLASLDTHVHHAHSPLPASNNPHCRSKERYSLPGARMP